MYRVLGPALLSALLAGCGMAASLTAGFANSGQPTSALPAHANGQCRNRHGERPGQTDALPGTRPEGKLREGAAGRARRPATTAGPTSTQRGAPAHQRLSQGMVLKPLALNAATEARQAAFARPCQVGRISHYGSDGSNPGTASSAWATDQKWPPRNVGTGRGQHRRGAEGLGEASPGGHKQEPVVARGYDHVGIALVQDPRAEFKTFWTLPWSAPRFVGRSNANRLPGPRREDGVH